MLPDVAVPSGRRLFDYRLSSGEQWLLAVWVLLVDAALVGITWVAGWHWFLLHGRVTLIVPTLLAAVTWYVRCWRKSMD